MSEAIAVWHLFQRLWNYDLMGYTNVFIIIVIIINGVH